MTDAPGSKRDHLSAVNDWPKLIAVAAVGAFASVIASGFLFGVNNNLFHLPIVAGLLDKPQFASDPFVQSLRHYASGIWLILRGSGETVEPTWVFLSLHFASRWMAFVGFLACAYLLGVRKSVDRAIFTVLLVLTPYMEGTSLAGGGGLFVRYFTHSEIGNGLTLLLVYFVLQARLAVALALNGLIFFVNAFMGVWNIGLLIMVTIALLASQRINLRILAGQSLVGLIIAILFATPVFHNVLANPEFGTPSGYDHLRYLEEYYPDHFLIWSIGRAEIAELALLTLAGAIAWLALGRASRLFLVAHASFVIVYLVGIAAPYFTSDPAILHLHLLRVSSTLHLFAVLALLVLVTRYWREGTEYQKHVVAPLLVLLLTFADLEIGSLKPNVLGVPVLLVALVAVVAASQWKALSLVIPQSIVSGYGKARWLALVLVAYGGVAHLVIISDRMLDRWSQTAEWRVLADWARTNTPEHAVFFIENPPSSSALFESVAERQSWIDWKRGGAAMWSPSYYHVWRLRLDEVQWANRSEQTWALYARRNGITHSIMRCESSPDSRVIFTTKNYCVYETPRS